MGFSGFSEMQRLFREAYSPGWPDYASPLCRTCGKAAPDRPRRCWRNSLTQAACHWRRWRNRFDGDAHWHTAVEVLSRAETVHVVGLRRAFPVASYLAYVVREDAGSGDAA